MEIRRDNGEFESILHGYRSWRSLWFMRFYKVTVVHKETKLRLRRDIAPPYKGADINYPKPDAPNKTDYLLPCHRYSVDACLPRINLHKPSLRNSRIERI